MHHPTNRIVHITPAMEHWLEREIVHVPAFVTPAMERYIVQLVHQEESI